MKDEMLNELDKEYEKKNLTKQQYIEFRTEIIRKSEQLAKLVEDNKAGKIDEETFSKWYEDISLDFKDIGERKRAAIDKNLDARKKKAENKHKRPFIIAICTIAMCVGAYFFVNWQYAHRSIDDVPEPVQVDVPEEEQGVVHVIQGKDLNRPGYQLEMYYLASYDIKGLVIDTHHYNDKTPFDKAFPVDVSIGWGQYAANRGAMDCHNNDQRKLKCEFNGEELDRLNITRTEMINLVSNNHLAPADRDIYFKLERIKPGDYVELKGYLVSMSILDDDGGSFQATSSLRRTDHMSSVFDTSDTGCEIMLVTSVDWL
jgi:hypothetical protein